MNKTKAIFLPYIDSPEDLRKLKEADLPLVCEELRQFIIDSVSVNGGHFAASLGVVELTVALHYVLNTPYDQLIWDVGHQAYGHKILTGRRDMFHTNRMYGGISGFPKRSESQYDAFGVGHSSTSISAALGMAVASKYNGEKNRQHVAVIGDGAMTGGMAFEAFNHAGIEDANLLVILNDNNISIDPNVGALRNYLTKMTASRPFNRFRDDIVAMVDAVSKIGPGARDIAKNMEKSLKSFLSDKSNLFEAFNFRYFGPVDGHNVKLLSKVIADLKEIPGPKLLHCVTVKGKGYELAELDQTKWHAPGLFDKNTGEIKVSKSDIPTSSKYQDVFGHTIIELAKQNPKIMGITPAMPSGCSLNMMMKEMPERAFDVGIAEQHAVTFSAGLATQGMIPFCNIYSSFLQRGYDQLIHDVAIQNLNVVFCIDRGGLVGADGATHHGVYDMAYLRCIPNITIAAPMDESELRNMMFTAQHDNQGPFAIRYPRGTGVMLEWRTPLERLQIGKMRQIIEGESVAIISIGHIGNVAKEACIDLQKEGLNPSLYDLRFLKPLDETCLTKIFKKYQTILTLEDGCLQGGMGSAILEYASDNGFKNLVVRLGIKDEFIEHGTPEQLYKECGIDKLNILTQVRRLFN